MLKQYLDLQVLLKVPNLGLFRVEELTFGLMTEMMVPTRDLLDLDKSPQLIHTKVTNSFLLNLE